MCGLKPPSTGRNPVWGVTPCVGVWIETSLLPMKAKIPFVTPCVGVWIETIAALLNACAEIVTPCVGVWIETIMHPRQTGQGIVTPCVGVWIETGKLAPDTLWTLSHPAWVCGLKQ